MLKINMIIVETVLKLVSASFFKKILFDVNLFYVACRKNQLESHNMIFDLKSLSGARLCYFMINLHAFGPEWDGFSVPL